LTAYEAEIQIKQTYKPRNVILHFLSRSVSLIIEKVLEVSHT